MRKNQVWSVLTLGTLLTLAGSPASALPGQTPEEVAAWIQAHPTLRPNSGEKLLVRKSDSAARRFTFQASVMQVGKIAPAQNSGVIRTERFSLFDMTNGVTKERLEESIRTIYGLNVFQDYAQAQIVYAYPGPTVVDQSINQRTPLLEALQGELRSGDRFAYWLELAQTRQGYAYSGQITVFLKEDLDKLETELRNR